MRSRFFARREIGGLAAFAVAAGGLLLFLELGGEVLEGEPFAFDRAVLLAMREPGDPADPLGPHWFESMARDLTALGSFAVLALLTLAVVGYLLITRRRAVAAFVAVAVGGGAIASSLLKGLFQRPRPDLVPHAVEVYSHAFPSGHAMLSAVTYLTLGALLARLETRRRAKLYLLGVAVLLTALVGVSRIYLGVHWPSDVLAGWCMGASWAIGGWTLLRRLQQRRIARRSHGDDAVPAVQPSRSDFNR